MFNANGGAVVLRYDPEGRLFQVVGSSNTYFLYDGNDVIAKYDNTGKLLERYVHGLGTDEPLVWYNGSTSSASDRSYLLADERGSIIAVTNNSGSVTNVNKYDADGAPAAANVGLFQYTGQMWITDVGLYYYKARFYNPWLGRFMQTDPIGTKGGMNLYAYVKDDPLNATDPTGMSGNWCWGNVPATATGGCPPVGFCEASHINTASGSICGGSYYDPSYYASLGDFYAALGQRPRNNNDYIASADYALGQAIQAELHNPKYLIASLTLTQQLKITAFSSAAGTVGSLFSPWGGAIAGGVVSAVATAYYGGSKREIENNTAIGALTGAEGGLLVNIIENAGRSALERVTYSSFYQGSIDALGLGADPIVPDKH